MPSAKSTYKVPIETSSIPAPTQSHPRTKFFLSSPRPPRRREHLFTFATTVSLLLAPGLAAEEPLTLPALHVGECRGDLVGRPSPGHDDVLSLQAAASRYSLPDLLRSLPGAVTQDSFGGFEPPRISLRGSGIQSAPVSRGFLPRWNELPLCWADGSFNTAWLDLALAEELSLKRGPAGWLDAGMTMGGSLELRSLPRAEKTDISLGVQGDAEGSHWGQLSATGHFPSGLLSLKASDTRYEGYRPWSQQERQALALGFQRKAQAFDLLLLSGSYQVPGPLTQAQVDQDPWPLPASVARDRPYREFELQRLGWTARTDSLGGQLLTGLSLQHALDDFRQLQANGITRQDSWDGGGTLQWESGAPGNVGIWVARADLLAGERRMTRYLNQSSLTGPLFSDDRLQSQTHSLLLQNRLPLGNQLRLDTGLSCLFASREREDLFAGTAGKLSHTWNDTALLPSALLHWEARPGLSTHLGYQANAEAPVFDDLLPVAKNGTGLKTDNKELSAQTAHTLETGLAWQAGSLRVGCDAYLAFWDKELLRLADAQGNALGTVNAGKTRHQGIELSLSHSLPAPQGRFQLGASGTLQEFLFQDDPVRKDARMGGYPPFAGRLSLRYLHKAGHWLGLGMDVQAGTTYADHARRLGYGGATRFQVDAGLRLHRHLCLQAGVQNLTDHRYIASTAGVLDIAKAPAATAIFLPASPRRYTFGFTADW